MLPMAHAELRTPLGLLDDALKIDPYQVLRIPFLAGKSQVREAFRTLCKTHHPDFNAGRESMEWLMGKFAYRILMDPRERAAYDTARVLRNALSLTEGVVAFSFAAAGQMASFAGDAAEVMGHAMGMFGGVAKMLAGGEEASAKIVSKKPTSKKSKAVFREFKAAREKVVPASKNLDDKESTVFVQEFRQARKKLLKSLADLDELEAPNLKSPSVTAASRAPRERSTETGKGVLKSKTKLAKQKALCEERALLRGTSESKTSLKMPDGSDTKRPTD